MEKKFRISAAVLAAAVSLAGCSRKGGEADLKIVQPRPRSSVTVEKPLKVGYSMPSATHGYMARCLFWARKGMSDWRAKDPEIEFLFVTADNVNKQANDIEDLIQKGIRALIVFPYDASVTAVVERAYRAGIFVVVMDRGTSKPVYDVYLSNDDVGYARIGTEWLAKQLNYKGNIVLIEGIPCPINTIRYDTIKSTLAQYPGIVILDSQPGEWNKQKALAVMENFLQKYGRIDAVHAADDDMMAGAMQAYRESGRTDIRFFLGGGCDKTVIKRILDDSDPLVKADVSYPPDQCATVVSVAVMGARERNFDGFYQRKLPSRIILSSELVTRENAARHYFPDEL